MNRLFLLLLLFSGLLSAQTNELIPTKKTQRGFASLDFLSVDMPSSDPRFPNEDHLGLLGKHYNLEFNNFYTGLGIYGALRGDRGGFFTLGVNLGYTTYLSEKLFLDTGIHFGGGGGAGAPDGGGAFILPKFNLGYQFTKFSLAGGYSYINFFDGGNIKSHQLNLALQIPLSIGYANFSDRNKSFKVDDLNRTEWDKFFSRFSFMFHLNNLRASGNSMTTRDESLNGSTIRLAGFEVSSFLNNQWFTFIRFDGAYNGIEAGYMDVLFGAGYRLTMNRSRTNVLLKAGIGGGGGGAVDTQGGVLIAPDISLEQLLFDHIYLAVNTGLVMSPNSHFYSRSYGVGLKYYANINGIQPQEDITKTKFRGLEFILKQEFYHRAQRITNPTEDLYQMAVQINYHLNDTFYLAGETAFANFGSAGAYAEGIVGIGIQTGSICKDRLNFFTQFLAGGAGGGNINTGQGLIIKPSAGFNYKLSNNLSLRTSGGFVRAKGGTLNAFSLNMGISYRLAFLTSK